MGLLRAIRWTTGVLPQLAIRRTYHLVSHVDTRRIARIDEAYRFLVEEVQAAEGLFL